MTKLVPATVGSLVRDQVFSLFADGSHPLVVVDVARLPSGEVSVEARFTEDEPGAGTVAEVYSPGEEVLLVVEGT